MHIAWKLDSDILYSASYATSYQLKSNIKVIHSQCTQSIHCVKCHIYLHGTSTHKMHIAWRMNNDILYNASYEISYQLKSDIKVIHSHCTQCIHCDRWYICLHGTSTHTMHIAWKLDNDILYIASYATSYQLKSDIKLIHSQCTQCIHCDRCYI